MHRSAVRALMVAAATATLAACGGGEDAAPAPPPAELPASAQCNLPDFEASVLARLNAHRARGADCGAFGLYAPAQPLAWNARLAAAAAGHSADMAERDYFDHVSPDGVTLAQRVDAAGYRWSRLGENIAAGQRSVGEVVDGWVDSDSHCSNVMDPRLTEVGVACSASADARYRRYWTMDAGRPR